MVSKMVGGLGRAASLVAILGLAIALCACGTLVREVRKDTTGLVSPPPADLATARTAWSYFEAANGAFESADGVREAVAGGGFTTPTAIGDQIAATVGAYRMGVIDRAAYESRIARILRFLDNANLSGAGLPGRFYDIRTARLTDPAAPGVDPGWSSIQIGRLLVWLDILAHAEPRLATLIGQIVSRWNLCQAFDADGRPLGSIRVGGKLVGTVETGTGYGDYALQGFRAWGVAAPQRAAPEPDASIEIEHLTIPLPDGVPAEPLMTAPFALIGMELGWEGRDGEPMDSARRFSDLTLEAQRRRFARTRTLTARSDFLRSADPYAVIDTVMSGGHPWSTTDGADHVHVDLALVSTRAAFGYWALRPLDGYGRRLVKAVTASPRPGGLVEGVYERGLVEEATQTADTNAFVLEALLYRQSGALYPVANRSARWAGPKALTGGPACPAPTAPAARHP
jgi:hypothetical protein